MGLCPAVPAAVLIESLLPHLYVSAVSVSSSWSCWSVVDRLELWQDQSTNQRV